MDLPSEHTNDYLTPVSDQFSISADCFRRGRLRQLRNEVSWLAAAGEFEHPVARLISPLQKISSTSRHSGLIPSCSERISCSAVTITGNSTQLRQRRGTVGNWLARE